MLCLYREWYDKIKNEQNGTPPFEQWYELLDF